MAPESRHAAFRSHSPKVFFSCERGRKRAETCWSVGRGFRFKHAHGKEENSSAKKAGSLGSLVFLPVGSIERYGRARDFIRNTPPPSPRRDARCAPRDGAIDVRSASRRTRGTAGARVHDRPPRLTPRSIGGDRDMFAKIRECSHLLGGRLLALLSAEGSDGLRGAHSAGGLRGGDHGGADEGGHGEHCRGDRQT